MTDRTSVAKWLEDYVLAWKNADAQAIGALFSEDADYYYSPYREPVRGREAIVADWLKNPDGPGSFEAAYVPVAVDGNTAVSHGRTRYYTDGKVTSEFDNIFIRRFDDEGRCTEFREWYMTPPGRG
jgi:ketosteroid isomerase-like protein